LTVELSWLAWLANATLVAGLWFVGKRRRWAFLLTFLGEASWVVVSASRGSADMLAICLVFAALAVVNFVRWGKKEATGCQ
jgi:nicotinamide riboside transporter PnuC